NASRDLALHPERIGEIAVERVAPGDIAGAAIDEFRVDTEATSAIAVGRPAHGSHQHLVDAKLARDVDGLLVRVTILVGTGRCYDRELVEPRQSSAYLVDDSVGEVGVLCSTLICERQHRDTAHLARRCGARPAEQLDA